MFPSPMPGELVPYVKETVTVEELDAEWTVTLRETEAARQARNS